MGWPTIARQAASLLALVLAALTLVGGNHAAAVVGPQQAPNLAPNQPSNQATKGGAAKQNAVLKEEGLPLFDSLNTPGLAVVEFDQARITTRAFYGKDGYGKAIQGSTSFAFGPVSQAFAAVVLTELAAGGKIDLDKPASNYLDDLKGSALADRGITVSDLLRHTSGLPNDFSMTDDWGRRGEALKTVKEVANTSDLGPRGTYLYSSLNYLLVQALIEERTHTSYGAALNKTMNNQLKVGKFIAHATDFEDEVPPGSAPFFGGRVAIPMGVDEAGFGYGYLAGSVNDLAAYGSWQLKDLVSQQRGAKVRRATQVKTSGGDTYGAGLFHRSFGDAGLVEVSGAVPGYYTHMLFDPAEGRGILLLANSYGELAAPGMTEKIRSFAWKRLAGIKAPDAPDSIYRTLLIVGVSVVVGLLVAIVVLTWPRRRRRAPLSRGEWTLRAVAVAAMGGTLIFGLFYFAQSRFGASPLVLFKWAPDVVALFWAVVGCLVILVFTVILRDAVRVFGQRPRHSVRG